jgi:hypothetical protein
LWSDLKQADVPKQEAAEARKCTEPRYRPRIWLWRIIFNKLLMAHQLEQEGFSEVPNSASFIFS